MFTKPKFEQRMALWLEFRESLEESEDPFRTALDFYNQAPLVNLNADPWDQDTWPTPWELVEWNQYCPFTTVLGICYSLQLTDRFKGSSFEIHIGIDRNTSTTYYLLYVGDTIIGWDSMQIDQLEITEDFESQMTYRMPPLQ